MCDERLHRPYKDEDIKREVVGAVALVVRRDTYLLANALYEPVLTHRIAVYLEGRFPTHDVDCEYNQNMGAAKATPDYGNLRPDILVHCRGHNNPWNLLAVEAKKVGRTGSDDLKKLRGLKSAAGRFRYQVVAFVRLGTRSALVDFGDAEPTLVPENGVRIRRVRAGWLAA